MDNNNNEGFSYIYSAKEQDELRRIREKYQRPTEAEETSMERLRRLDRCTTHRALAVSLTLGILGILIMGFGMSAFMTAIIWLCPRPYTLPSVSQVLFSPCLPIPSTTRSSSASERGSPPRSCA